MSVNADTTNIPLEIHHDGVTHIVQWGLDVAMTSAVAGAFRHVPFNCWFRPHSRDGYYRSQPMFTIRLDRITGALFHHGATNQSEY
jgi:hypothetical protein